MWNMPRPDFIWAPWLNVGIIIPVIVLLGVLFFIINYSYTRARRRREEIRMHQYDYIPPENLSFEEKLKAAKMDPDKHILYGQNEFARVSEKRCIFAQSSKMPDGILVHYQDILSFELIRDGETIAGKPTGSTVRNLMQANTASPYEDESGSKIYCSELVLKIAIKDEYNPVIVMPFIFYPFKVESDYLRALNAAQEIAKILDEILLLKTEEKAKALKTSLDA